MLNLDTIKDYSEEELIEYILAFSRMISAIDLEDILEHCNQIEKNFTNFKKIKPYIVRVHGLIYFIKYKNNEASKEFEKAKKMFENNNDENGLAEVLMSITLLNLSMKKIEKGIKLALKALSIFKKLNNKGGQAKALSSIGQGHYFYKDYDNCIKYYKLALEIYESLDDNIGIGAVSFNIGSAYIDKNKIEESDFYVKEFSTYLDKAMNSYKKMNYDYGVAICLVNYCDRYIFQKEYKEALKMILKAIRIFKKLKLYSPLSYNYITVSDIYINTNKIDKALKYIKLAYETAIEYNLEREEQLALKSFYLLNKKNKNYKEALSYYENFYELEKKIYDKEQKTNINELTIKYESEIYKLKNVELVEANNIINEKNKELKDAYNKLKMLASIDPLTKIFNRRAISEKLENIKESNEIFTIGLMDIDFFKKVNDTYGHDGGDVILKIVAKTIKDNIKKYGYVSRWGGEEFLMIIEKSGLEKSLKVIKKIKKAINDLEIEYDGHIIKIGITIGLSEFNGDIHDTINIADKLLYVGKNKGRNIIITKME